MTAINPKVDKFLLRLADVLEFRAIRLGERAEAKPCANDDEHAEYIWTCVTASTVAMLISESIRDVVKSDGRAAPGIH